MIGTILVWFLGVGFWSEFASEINILKWSSHVDLNSKCLLRFKMRSILTRSSVRNAWRTGRSTTLPLQRNFSFGPFGKPQPTQILEIDLSPGGLDLTNTDHPNLQLMSQKQQIPLFRALQALQKAAYDEKIAGVSFILGRSLNLSDVQELRKIVQLFKSQGKITSVFAENYSSEWNYYLASAFQNIWMVLFSKLFLFSILLLLLVTNWFIRIKSKIRRKGVHSLERCTTNSWSSCWCSKKKRL